MKGLPLPVQEARPVMAGANIATVHVSPRPSTAITPRKQAMMTPRLNPLGNNNGAKTPRALQFEGNFL